MKQSEYPIADAVRAAVDKWERAERSVAMEHVPANSYTRRIVDNWHRHLGDSRLYRNNKELREV